MDLPEEIRSKLAELDLELSEGKSWESSLMDFESGIVVQNMCQDKGIQTGGVTCWSSM